MLYIGAMLNAPAFSFPRLGRLGDRLQADGAAGAFAGADLMVGA